MTQTPLIFFIIQQVLSGREKERGQGMGAPVKEAKSTRHPSGCRPTQSLPQTPLEKKKDYIVLQKLITTW